MTTTKTATPTLPIVQALDAALNSVRSRHPEVPKGVVLVVGASGKSHGGMKHGHFAPNSWQVNSGKVAADTHEIFFSGESLQRGAEATLGTLLHECAHVVAFERGVQDTSRQHRYHNTKFRSVAQEMGIEVAHDPSLGWSVTTLPKSTAKEYAVELAAIRRALKAHRRGVVDGVTVKPPAEKRTIKLETASGRKLTVPIKFFEEGDIFDATTGEMFAPAPE